jgi:membrane fusion protein, multidrug efflux system
MHMISRIGAHAALCGAIGAIVLASAGCGASGDRQGFAMPPMAVEVSPVATQNMEDKFEAVGTIEAIQAITVVGEIDAAVKGLPFVEGGALKRNAMIAQLDDAQLAAEVARSQALLAQSKGTYDRIKRIVDQGAGSLQDLDDAAAALKVAEANLDLANARLSKTKVIAPFDGIVGARRVSVGTFLRGGQAITELANIDDIRVTFSAPERFLDRLTQGATVTVSSPAFQGMRLRGRIAVVEPMIDPLMRSARIVATVHNEGRKFRPGMSANVAAVLSQRNDALTIPSESVFGSGNQSFVFLVKPDSTVSRVPVTLGIRTANVVEVLGGLQANALVVRAGHQKLFDGGKVLPIAGPPAASAGSPSHGG